MLNQPIARVAARHLVGERREDPSAGRRPGVPDSHRAAVHVDATPVHRTSRRTFPPALPRSGVGHHLCGKGLVDLEEIDVRKPNAGLLEHSRHRDGGCHEQTLTWIDSRIAHGFDESEGLAAFFQCPLLAHQQDCGGTVCDASRGLSRVGSGVSRQPLTEDAPQAIGRFSLKVGVTS